MTQREVLTYTDLGVPCRELAQAVADSGYAPDLILSIARGAWAWAWTSPAPSR